MARKINDSLDLQGNELQNVQLQNLASPTDSGWADGRIWYDTGLDTVRVRANGATVSLAAGGAVTPGSITFAATDRLLGRDTAGGGAGEEIALTGGLAFTGSLSIGIATNGIVTGMITDANVTYAKLPTQVTDSLLGRDTTGTGAPEVITLDTTLTMNGSQVLSRAALTGDVTTAVNVATIAANAVTTAKILDKNVTLAKLPDITTDSLIGRDTTASGVPEVITLGTSLVMNGSQVLQRAALTGDVTAAADGNATTIGALKVVTGMIAANAVDNTKSAQMAATTLKANPTGALANATDITLAADLAFSGTTLQTAAFTGGVVTKSAGSVAVTIAASAVTNAMHANMAADTVKMNNTGSPAAPLDITKPNFKTWLALASTDVSGLGSLATVSNLTGNVTSVGAATTIAASVVTNAMQVNMNANTVKMNNTGSAAAPIDVTLTNFKTWLALVAADLPTLNNLTAPSGSLSLNNQLITNLATPVSATDATTKAYVDSISVGLDPKASVRVASSVAISGATYNATGGTSGRGQFTTMPLALTNIDAGTAGNVVAGDRVLLKDQASGAQNGIWVVTTIGAGATGVWDRATDFDQDAEVTAGAHVWVEMGTVNADSGWVLTTDNPITIGGASGTALAWVQFSGAGQITAGNALTKNGNTLDVAVSTGLEINADAIRLAAASASTGLTGGAGSALAVNPGTSLELSGNTVRLAATAAGTGLSGGGASALSVNHAVVPYLFAGTLTGGALFEDVTHSLGTKDVLVQVYNLTGAFAEEEFTIEHKTTNIVTIRSATTIPGSTYRVVVLG